MDSQTLEKYIDTCRSMIMHENELVNHRMVWLLTSQSLLLAGAIFLLEKMRNGIGLCATILLATIGVLICLSIARALISADLAIEKVQQVARKCIKESGIAYEGPPIMGWSLEDSLASPTGQLPPLSRKRLFYKQLRGLPSRRLPLLMVAIWVLWVILFAVATFGGTKQKSMPSATTRSVPSSVMAKNSERIFVSWGFMFLHGSRSYPLYPPII